MASMDITVIILLLVSCAFASPIEFRIKASDQSPKGLQNRESKAVIVIHENSMAGVMLQYAKQISTSAVERNQSNAATATEIRDFFTNTFRPNPAAATWDVVVGEIGSFNAQVSREPSRVFFASVNNKDVLIYQTKR